MALHDATAELVANSVRHAYRDADVEARPVSVSAEVTDSGRVVVEVVDQGRWREAETPEQQPLSGGRGLSLARLLTDESRSRSARAARPSGCPSCRFGR